MCFGRYGRPFLVSWSTIFQTLFLTSKSTKMVTPNYNIYLYLRHSRSNKGGKVPIYVRIRIQKDRTEFPSGQNVDPKHWDDKKQKAVKTDEAGTINSVLQAVKAEINQAIAQLYISKSEVSIDNIRLLLKGDALQDAHTFLKVAQEHNDNFEKQIGKKYSYGSFKNYKTTLKCLREFVPKFYGKNDMPLKEVNYKFCEAYFTYLTIEKTCHQNGANKQIQRVKKLINAIRLGYIQTNPMATYSIEFTPVNKVALTIAEINKLAGLDLQRQTLKNVRDVFLLQCYTGLSYADIKQLSKVHVSTGDNGTLWIRMKRQKTSVSFAIPVLQPAMEILNKYMPDASPISPILPVLSNQKMNNNLKLLQELAGISKSLTTHLARHSFATTIHSTMAYQSQH